ncbi:MAG: hypothetical protein ACOCXG_00410 [Nanoarchaeota archaeon]
MSETRSYTDGVNEVSKNLGSKYGTFFTLGATSIKEGIRPIFQDQNLSHYEQMAAVLSGMVPLMGFVTQKTFPSGPTSYTAESIHKGLRVILKNQEYTRLDSKERRIINPKIEIPDTCECLIFGNSHLENYFKQSIGENFLVEEIMQNYLGDYTPNQTPTLQELVEEQAKANLRRGLADKLEQIQFKPKEKSISEFNIAA